MSDNVTRFNAGVSGLRKNQDQVHELQQAIEQTFPLLRKMSQLRIISKLPEQAPARIAFVALWKEMSTEGNGLGLASSVGATLRLDTEKLAGLRGDGGRGGQALMTAMGRMVNAMAYDEVRVLGLVPETDRTEFLAAYNQAGRAITEFGIRLNHQVAGFGQTMWATEQANRVTPVTSIERGENLASDMALHQAAGASLDTLNAMHFAGVRFPSTRDERKEAAARMGLEEFTKAEYMWAIASHLKSNLEYNLQEADFLLPGESSIRTKALSEQPFRGTRAQAEEIAQSARLFSQSMADPNIMQALIFENNSDFGKKVLDQRLKGLDASIKQIDGEAQDVARARNAYDLSPKQAASILAVLIAAEKVTSLAQLSTHTEIARPGDIANQNERDRGTNKEESEDLTKGFLQIESMSEATADIAADKDEFVEAVGTVIVPREVLDQMNRALKELSHTGADVEISNGLEINGAEDLRLPFKSTRDAQCFLDMINAAKAVGTSVKGRDGLIEVPVRETHLMSLAGPVDEIFNNDKAMRLAHVAGRNGSDLMKIALNRGTALYATPRDASSDRPDVRIDERLSKEIPISQRIKSVMTTEEWKQLRDSEKNNKDRLAIINSRISHQEFDPKTHPLTAKAYAQVEGTAPSTEDMARGRNTTQRAIALAIKDQELLGSEITKNGTERKMQRDDFLRFSEERTQVVISPRRSDGVALRQAAKLVAELRRQEINEGAKKWLDNPNLPKGSVIIEADSLKRFAKMSEDSLDLAQVSKRDGRIVLEHPDAPTLRGEENKMEKIRDYVGDNQRLTFVDPSRLAEAANKAKGGKVQLAFVGTHLSAIVPIADQKNKVKQKNDREID